MRKVIWSEIIWSAARWQCTVIASSCLCRKNSETMNIHIPKCVCIYIRPVCNLLSIFLLTTAISPFSFPQAGISAPFPIPSPLYSIFRKWFWDMPKAYCVYCNNWNPVQYIKQFSLSPGIHFENSITIYFHITCHWYWVKVCMQYRYTIIIIN